MGQFLIDHLLLVIVIGMIATVGIWHAWAFHLKPLAIPKAEIDAIVDELIEQHGPDAEGWARSYEEEAWYRSDTVQQGRVAPGQTRTLAAAQSRRVGIRRRRLTAPLLRTITLNCRRAS